MTSFFDFFDSIQSNLSALFEIMPTYLVSLIGTAITAVIIIALKRAVIS